MDSNDDSKDGHNNATAYFGSAQEAQPKGASANSRTPAAGGTPAARAALLRFERNLGGGGASGSTGAVAESKPDSTHRSSGSQSAVNANSELSNHAAATNQVKTAENSSIEAAAGQQSGSIPGDKHSADSTSGRSSEMTTDIDPLASHNTAPAAASGGRSNGDAAVASTLLSSAAATSNSPEAKSGGVQDNSESGAAMLTRRSVASAPVPFVPQIIMDGTKLIMKLGRSQKFCFDSPCRILLATPRIKLQHENVWTTTGICQDPENTVVVDGGDSHMRFIPIPLSTYGILYTKERSVHVVVGVDVRRTKVHSRHLPYKSCNKFQVQYTVDSDHEDGAQQQCAIEGASSNNTPSRFFGRVSPARAAKLVQTTVVDPGFGWVYLRGDDSLVRYKLKQDERIEIHSGQVVAWTLGVRFEYRSVCCFRFVTTVLGDGTVWIANPRRSRS